MKDIETLLKELEYAKRATLACLENSSALVDMHGLSYWAERVEKLRKEIINYCL